MLRRLLPAKIALVQAGNARGIQAKDGGKIHRLGPLDVLPAHKRINQLGEERGCSQALSEEAISRPFSKRKT